MTLPMVCAAVNSPLNVFMRARGENPGNTDLTSDILKAAIYQSRDAPPSLVAFSSCLAQMC